MKSKKLKKEFEEVLKALNDEWATVLLMCRAQNESPKFANRLKRLVRRLGEKGEEKKSGQEAKAELLECLPSSNVCQHLRDRILSIRPQAEKLATKLKEHSEEHLTLEDIRSRTDLFVRAVDLLYPAD